MKIWLVDIYPNNATNKILVNKFDRIKRIKL